MGDSFETRVKRLFGSKLFESVPDSSFPATSWSVAEGEVERREWLRDRGGGAAADDREDIPCSSAFSDEDGCFSKKPQRPRNRKAEFEGEDLEDEEEPQGTGDDEVRREEREIRSFVGFDPTLDHEDEEDEYDRVALCMEDDGERVYMRDVKDHGPYLNCRAVVPDLLESSLEEIHQPRRDLRADHFTASLRLREDESISTTHMNEDVRAKTSEPDANLKPILKRKEAHTDSKPKKRVRFDTECQEGGRDEVFEEPQDFQTVPRQEETIGVPDYIRNPSKYTRYNFDLSEEDEANDTNRQGFEDFRNLVNASNTARIQLELPVDLPTTVTFTPRKKASDAMPVDDSCKEKGQGLICSTEIDTGSCEMEEDDKGSNNGVNTRKGRQYRGKATSEDST